MKLFLRQYKTKSLSFYYNLIKKPNELTGTTKSSLQLKNDLQLCIKQAFPVTSIGTESSLKVIILPTHIKQCS